MSNCNHRQDRRGEVWEVWGHLYLVIRRGTPENRHWTMHHAMHLESGELTYLKEHESNSLEMSNTATRLA